MKYSINKFTAGALLTVAAMTAPCSSDYLNVSPAESAEPPAAYANTSNARNTLNGITKSMTVQQYYYGQGLAGENATMHLYENLPSQNYNYNRYASGWVPIHNQDYHYRSTTKYDSYAWAYYSQIINNANVLLANIDNATGSDADKKFTKASALTFRAHAYEKLIHYYCYRWQDSNNGTSQGLPLRLDTSTGHLKASALAETYAQIYKNCQDAITLFTESGAMRSTAEYWIPDINTAHVVYTRATLIRQDYATALAQAKLAQINRPLMTGDAYAAGSYRPNDKWILGSYGDASEQNWYWAFGVQGACNGHYASTQGTGAGITGHELITRIPNNNACKQLFTTADKFRSIDTTRDIQVNQTYSIIGLGDEGILAQADSIVKKHQIAGLSAAYASGYTYSDGQMKFWATAQPGVSYVPSIRSSEMVLIEAEANCFLGNTVDAQAVLVKLSATTGCNSDYTCIKTSTDLLNEIKSYREVEPWGEGFAWSDYKHWNIPIVHHSFAQGGNTHAAAAKTVAVDYGNKWTWVVPQNEIDYNDPLSNE